MNPEIRIAEEWEQARLQIASILNRLSFYGDIASTLNAKELFTVETNSTTEVSIDHGYNGIPSGYIVIGQDGPGTLYYSKDSDNAKMYFKSDAAAGIKFNIMIF